MARQLHSLVFFAFKFAVADSATLSEDMWRTAAELVESKGMHFACFTIIKIAIIIIFFFFGGGGRGGGVGRGLVVRTFFAYVLCFFLVCTFALFLPLPCFASSLLHISCF